jgi:hypothetical protein
VGSFGKGGELMPPRTKRGVKQVALGVALCLSACPRGEDERHVLPRGFSGPVVILYAIPGSLKLERGIHGERLYRIPPSGVLVTSSEPPPPRYAQVTFVSEDDASTSVIPYGSSPENARQVFALLFGSAWRQGMVGTVGYQSYFVGIPASTPSPKSQMDELLNAALDEIHRRGPRRQSWE